MPLLVTSSLPIYILILSLLAFSPDLPIAIIILPQFASSPAIAVLTKGELATENAIFFADFVEEAPSNFMVINLEAPSPSITIN